MNAQNGNCALACDGAQVSLDEDCQAEVTVQMIAADLSQCPNGDFVVYVIETATGDTIPTSPFVYEQHIGVDLYASVYDLNSGQSCWAPITVEDKLPPQIDCECAGITEISGVLTENDPSADLNEECWNFTGFFIPPSGTHYYHTTPFVITMPGMYTFAMSGTLTDGIGAIFNGDFDPMDVCANMIGGDDDNGPGLDPLIEITLNLVPGDYTLVTSTWNVGGTGSYVWDVSGPGAVFAQGGLENCVVNCLEAFGDTPPTVTENCSTAEVILVNETTTPICHPDYIKMLRRNYVAIDESGNVSDTCESVLFLERIDFGLIDWPDSLSVLSDPNLPPLSCSDDFLDEDGDGVPDPAPLALGGAGVPRIDGVPVFPEFIGFCNSQIFVEDVMIGPIGCTKKIMRMWTAFEWHCQGEEDTLYIQLIEIIDDEGPILVCPDDLTVSTNAYNCEALVHIPVPFSEDECNDVVQISVQYPGGFADNILGTNGIYVDLPVGDNEITYTSYDECYNSTTCVWTVTVEDHTPPVPVCDEHTVVSLTTDGLNGLTLVNASVFDDGSYDECGDVTFTARRMTSCIDFDWTTLGAGIDEVPDGFVFDFDRGTIHRPYVPFACCDVDSDPFMIELHVTDESGNVNTCMVEVTVQDKIGPFIDCPADITVSCDFDFDFNDLSIFGTVETDEALRDEICVFDPTNPAADGLGFVCIGLDGIAGDNCSVTVTETSTMNIDNCGTGYIERWFTATDAGGRTADCHQTIYIENFHPFYINPWNNNDPNDDVIWPPNVDVTGCGSDVEPDATGEPIIFQDECDLIGVTYDDVVFEFVQGACFKILRTWQIIDWCQFEPSSNSPTGYTGLWEYQQVIKVLDDEDPVFTTDQPDIEECNELDCDDLFIELIQMGTDDCTPDEELWWSYGIDLDNNGTIDDGDEGIGTTIDASRFFPIGTHRVIYTFEDNCGNQTVREQIVTVLACKAPTPICFFGLSADLMADGTVTLWASDFDKGSYHACGYPVTVSFSPDTTDKSRVFTCDNLGTNPVQLWVTDLVIGEQDYCETFIDIQDNMEVCGDNVNTGIISGLITTEMSDNVNEVQVDLDGNGTTTANTDQTGQYMFPSMPFGDTYEVVPFKNTDWTNGVSTLDLIRIQKHLLGMEALASPYKMIAADANNSGAVSAVDLVLLRKLILGVISELPENSSWRFVEASYEFSNPDDPLTEDFPESYLIDGFLSSMQDVNFVGIKVGDVNNSVQAGAITGETESSGSLAMMVEDRDVQAGEIIELTFTAAEAGELMGYQFTVNFDRSALAFESFEAASVDVTEENFGLNRLDEGMITTSWSQIRPVSVSAEEELFVLKMRAMSDGSLRDMLSLGSEITKSEAYSAAGAVKEVILDFQAPAIEEQPLEFALLQNRPNPFDANTTIAFTLPAADEVILQVFDLTGRSIYSAEVDGVAGYNEVIVESTDLNADGVLYYTVQTEEFSATRKMIRLR